MLPVTVVQKMFFQSLTNPDHVLRSHFPSVLRITLSDRKLMIDNFQIVPHALWTIIFNLSDDIVL